MDASALLMHSSHNGASAARWLRLSACSLESCGLRLTGRLEKCDPELISTVMEYCLQMRCHSKTIFEAVAENFVCQAERHTTLQIAKQIIAMGRLNYLPQVSVL